MNKTIQTLVENFVNTKDLSTVELAVISETLVKLYGKRIQRNLVEIPRATCKEDLMALIRTFNKNSWDYNPVTVAMTLLLLRIIRGRVEQERGRAIFTLLMFDPSEEAFRGLLELIKEL